VASNTIYELFPLRFSPNIPTCPLLPTSPYHYYVLQSINSRHPASSRGVSHAMARSMVVATYLKHHIMSQSYAAQSFYNPRPLVLYMMTVRTDGLRVPLGSAARCCGEKLSDPGCVYVCRYVVRMSSSPFHFFGVIIAADKCCRSSGVPVPGPDPGCSVFEVYLRFPSNVIAYLTLEIIAWLEARL